MCNDNLVSGGNCIADILRIIDVLQRNIEEQEEILDSCDKRVLGPCCPVFQCNTRPVQLFTDDSNGLIPWSMPISREPNETERSSVFRVEKVEGNCCTFRVLKQIPCEKKDQFRATNSFFTMNLACVCCIRCLEDTFVDCV